MSYETRTYRPHIDTRADRVAPGELTLSLVRGEGYLGFTRNGWQETLGVHMTSGAPEQLIVLPRATYLPLKIALATAAAVIAMLYFIHHRRSRRPAGEVSGSKHCRALS